MEGRRVVAPSPDTARTLNTRHASLLAHVEGLLEFAVSNSSLLASATNNASESSWHVPHFYWSAAHSESLLRSVCNVLNSDAVACDDADVFDASLQSTAAPISHAALWSQVAQDMAASDSMNDEDSNAPSSEQCHHHFASISDTYRAFQKQRNAFTVQASTSTPMSTHVAQSFDSSVRVGSFATAASAVGLSSPFSEDRSLAAALLVQSSPGDSLPAASTTQHSSSTTLQLNAPGQDPTLPPSSPVRSEPQPLAVEPASTTALSGNTQSVESSKDNSSDVARVEPSIATAETTKAPVAKRGRKSNIGLAALTNSGLNQAPSTSSRRGRQEAMDFATLSQMDFSRMTERQQLAFLLAQSEREAEDKRLAERTAYKIAKRNAKRAGLPAPPRPGKTDTKPKEENSETENDSSQSSSSSSLDTDSEPEPASKTTTTTTTTTSAASTTHATLNLSSNAPNRSTKTKVEIEHDSAEAEEVKKPVKSANKNANSQLAAIHIGKNNKLEVWLPDDFDTWPAERQRLWKRVPVDPNAYYYKYPPPGVERKSSNWNARDRMEFIRALQQRPAEGQWGLFSMNFPGRTGQQCEEYFVKLHAYGDLQGLDIPDMPQRSKKPIPESESSSDEQSDDQPDDKVKSERRGPGRPPARKKTDTVAAKPVLQTPTQVKKPAGARGRGRKPSSPSSSSSSSTGTSEQSSSDLSDSDSDSDSDSSDSDSTSSDDEGRAVPLAQLKALRDASGKPPATTPLAVQKITPPATPSAPQSNVDGLASPQRPALAKSTASSRVEVPTVAVYESNNEAPTVSASALAAAALPSIDRLSSMMAATPSSALNATITSTTSVVRSIPKKQAFGAMVRPSSSTPSVAHTPTSAAPTPAVTGSELKKRKLPDEPDHDEQGDESTIKKIKIELPAESMQDAEAEFGSNAEAAQIDAAAAAAAEEERAARRAAKLAKKQQKAEKRAAKLAAKVAAKEERRQLQHEKHKAKSKAVKSDQESESSGDKSEHDDDEIETGRRNLRRSTTSAVEESMTRAQNKGSSRKKQNQMIKQRRVSVESDQDDERIIPPNIDFTWNSEADAVAAAADDAILKEPIDHYYDSDQDRGKPCDSVVVVPARRVFGNAPPGFRLPVDSELDRAFQFSESSDEQQRADLFAKFRLEQNRLRAHFEREWRRVHLKCAIDRQAALRAAATLHSTRSSHHSATPDQRLAAAPPLSANIPDGLGAGGTYAFGSCIRRMLNTYHSHAAGLQRAAERPVRRIDLVKRAFRDLVKDFETAKAELLARQDLEASALQLNQYGLQKERLRASVECKKLDFAAESVSNTEAVAPAESASSASRANVVNYRAAELSAMSPFDDVVVVRSELLPAIDAEPNSKLWPPKVSAPFEFTLHPPATWEEYVE